MDYIGGCGYGSAPCLNCETEPAAPEDLFCDWRCRLEYEGEDWETVQRWNA